MEMGRRRSLRLKVRELLLNREQPAEVSGITAGGNQAEPENVVDEAAPGHDLAEEEPENVVKLECVFEVFNQPQLRKIILNYAIRETDGGLCADYVKNVSLTCTSFKDTVKELLLQNLEPLYTLTLDENNSRNGTPYVVDNGKILDKFLNFLSTSAKVKRGVATAHFYRLKMMEGFFRKENYDSLKNCLKNFSGGLVELELLIPENGGSLPGILPDVTLPVLQKLTIAFTGSPLENVEESTGLNTANVTILVQSLLHGNRSLKQLSIYTKTAEEFYSLPGFQYISLPVSITKIVLDYRPSDQELEFLVRNRLPNLRSLILTATRTPFPAGLLTRILQNVCKTLKALVFYGEAYSGPPRNSNLLQFPVMDKLESLEIHNIHFELEQDIPDLAETFPKLKSLILYDRTPTMFRKWIGSGSVLPSLEEFTVELVNDKKPESKVNTQPISLQLMRSIHAAFPNLQGLYLRLLSGVECATLQYVFGEMTKLEELSIVAVGSETEKNSVHYDSLITGLPNKLVEGLLACRDFWGKMKLDVGEDVPSIKNMTKLSRLTLEAEAEKDAKASGSRGHLQSPIISDVTFAFALLQMPGLKELMFKGRFAASQAMTEEWEKKGAKIEYQA